MGQARRLPLGRRPGPENRPLLATTTRSVTSRSTGLAALRNEPQAHDPLAPSAFCQTISPLGRSRRPVLEDGHHVGGQAPVGLAAEVGHVDGDAPARLERPGAVGEDVLQQAQVLEVGAGDALAVQLLLVLLAGEVRGGGDHERHRAVGHRGHVPGVPVDEGLGDRRRAAGTVSSSGELRGLEPGVEGPGVVRLTTGDTEVGGRGPATRWHGGGADASGRRPGGRGPRRAPGRRGSGCWRAWREGTRAL